VLIYLHDASNFVKRDIAKDLLAENPKIPSPVISEYLNVTHRLLNLSKDELLIQASGLFSGCTIISISPKTLSFAADLLKRYKFQLFDAVIVATAIEGRSEILYSEDMHHGLVVDKRLTIFNPFL